MLFVPWRSMHVTVDYDVDVAPVDKSKMYDRVHLGADDISRHAYDLGHASLSEIAPGSEYRSKNRTWKDQVQSPRVKTRKVFSEVWYTGRISVLLFGMTDGQIYIRGHGLPGRPTISSSDEAMVARLTAAPTDAVHLTAVEVADRLIDSGLQPGFRGKIKCYNCHSADAGVEESSFGQLFADVMAARGYRACTYWGYFGALSSVYEDSTDVSEVMPGGQRVLHKNTKLHDGTILRSSAQRYAIQPRT